MRTSDFDYDLPEALIAHYPLENRSDSRLLIVGEHGPFQHETFSHLPALINPNDLIVVNNTRVIAARLFAKKVTGGQAEIFIERVEDTQVVLAQVRASRSPKAGSRLIIYTDHHYTEALSVEVTMLERQGEFFRLSFDQPVFDVLDAAGHMPLPPYIDREDELSDRLRYQTVFAKNAGAVAAPTAGLHFDDAVIGQLKAKGVAFAEVTLHVGAGTFQPVKVDDVEQHRMHSEWISVGLAVCQAVKECHARGGRVVAVGTTAVRALESASQSGEIAPFEGFTDIFIYPGYRFRSVDAMITNFHLPQSTLLMLVSAFVGKSRMLAAYEEAVQQRYRFFSYGDAMFLTKVAHSVDQV